MILDTNILIDVLGNRPGIQEKLEKIGEQIATTAITKYELLRGPREADAMALLETMGIYGFEGKSPERSAKIFKELKKKGKMINEFDILIASIAISHDELLVTRDKDFKNVDDLKLLIL